MTTRITKKCNSYVGINPPKYREGGTKSLFSIHGIATFVPSARHSAEFTVECAQERERNVAKMNYENKKHTMKKETKKQKRSTHMHEGRERHIVHLDMDAFFAAIEQRDEPRLRGKPVIIGADPKEGRGRGVVSTCSYEARKFGIRSAMPISEAYKRCPHGIYITPHMRKYTRASEEMYEILYSFTPDIEQVSVDEAFLDITTSFHLFGKTAREVCQLMKDRIRNELQLTASIGLSPTKMISKIASDLEKPDGLVEVRSQDIERIIWPLSVRKLWGIGPKSVDSFHKLGLITIGDIAQQTETFMQKHFGSQGIYYRNCALGIEADNVTPEETMKSISHEHTFRHDTTDEREIKDSLMYLSERVASRMRSSEYKGRTITLKVRLRGFKTYTRSITRDTPTNTVIDIFTCIMRLYETFEYKDKPIRLIGVKVSGFEQADVQSDLFSAERDQKLDRIYTQIDKIQKKYGFDAIYHARRHPFRRKEE